MIKKSILLSILFLVVLASVFADDSAAETAADSAAETSEARDSELSEDNSGEEKPSEDPRRLTLLYGIDTEVLSLLGDLRNERIAAYNEILVEVMAGSRNSSIDSEIFNLWSLTEWTGGLEMARAELRKVIEDDDFDTTTVQSAIAYISDCESPEAGAELSEIIDSRDTALAASAVRAIGKLSTSIDGLEEIGASLLERLEKEDPVAEDDLVASIINTLGSLEYEPAANQLVAIMEDDGAPVGHRRLACIAVGKIGRDIDFPLVENIYYDSTDATLRSYALAGLAEFEDQDTASILVQALTRDSFWRIRLTAAEKIGEAEITSASDLLKYKAAHDPVVQVKIAALKALGRIDAGENGPFISEYFVDDSKGADVRLAALAVLVENRIPGTNEAVFQVMDSLWEKDQNRFLEFTCRDLSRLSWPDLAPVYDRMLDHENWLLQVYGIRGIRKNELADLYGKVDALDADGVDGKVRREVTSGQSSSGQSR